MLEYKKKLYNNIQIESFRKHTAMHLKPHCSWLLAYSGGLDSTVLLDVLNSLKNNDKILDNMNYPKLRAVYVHHGLNKNADHWAIHCENECRVRGISFNVKYVDLNAMSNNGGIEATARFARYRVLTKMLLENEVLITAQHIDDQAETFFLALKRGSGPAGLASMANNTLIYGRRLIRPLLEYSREDIETYAYTLKLNWVEDDSNIDLKFDRNFMRLQILTPLKQRWPQFAKVVARSAKLCAEQEQLLDELLKETLSNLIQPDGSLCLKKLRNISDIQRAVILRRWLSYCNVRMPSSKQLTCLWKNIALSRADSIAQMQIDGHQVRRFKNCLYVIPSLPVFSKNTPMLFWSTKKNEKVLKLPSRLGIIFGRSAIIIQDKIHAIYQNKNILKKNLSDSVTIGSMRLYKIIVRPPLKHEQVLVRFAPVKGLIYIVGRKHGRTLKKIWHELSVPPWLRNCIPLLFYNDSLIAALGVFITLEGVPKKSKDQWNFFWKTNIVTTSIHY